MIGPATLWKRWRRGSTAGWTWSHPRDRGRLPADFHRLAMTWPVVDRYHAKQGRSTARVRVEGPHGPIWGYLKRHRRLPWRARLAAWLDPKGGHSPAASECRRLGVAADLGLAVPRAVAAGERLGPRAQLHSYLLVSELSGQSALNEILPELAESRQFEAIRRHLASGLADAAATLHDAGWFHKDLYLCHFFVDPTRPLGPVALIDFGRMARHRWINLRWRCKDLGQLLYSTAAVAALTDRDRLRFWSRYRRRCRMRWPALVFWLVRLKAGRYRRHNARATRGTT